MTPDSQSYDDQTLRTLLDEALDDLPRYMAVTQAPDGWVGLEHGPTMIACVTVDHVRAMIRTAGRGRNAAP